MKLFLKYVVAFVLVGVLCFPAYCSDPEDEYLQLILEGGFISGKVTKTDGKTPIAEVKLGAYRKGEKYQPGNVGLSQTNENGEYIIKELASGEFTVVANKPGYVDSTKYNISVASKKVTENINFILIEEATISGKVTESDGITPIPWVMVSIDGSDKMPKGANTTDEEGKYKIPQILPDKYWIRVTKDGYVMEVTLPTPIEEGQEITNLNFKLEIAATISGKVMIKDTTEPVEKAVIFATSEGKVYDYDSSGNNGEYSLQGLPSGAYHIVIRAKNYLPFVYEMNITTGQDIRNKNFYLEPAK